MTLYFSWQAAAPEHVLFVTAMPFTSKIFAYTAGLGRVNLPIFAFYGRLCKCIGIFYAFGMKWFKICNVFFSITISLTKCYEILCYKLAIRPGSSCGFGALFKGLTSVVDNSCRSRGSNPQPPRVTPPHTPPPPPPPPYDTKSQF